MPTVILKLTLPAIVTYALRFRYFNSMFIESVEDGLDIPKEKNDVGITVVPVLFTRNEANFQVEVQYTYGKDEYGTGYIFDPTEQCKKFTMFMILATIRPYTNWLVKSSAWVIGHKDTAFMTGEEFAYQHPRNK